ncbi:MAG: VanZ family protein [Bacteroidales bacterium]
MRIISFWKSITWALLILLACLLPSSSINKIADFSVPHFDKVVHFGIFFILTILLISDYNRMTDSRISYSQKLLASALIVFAYGLAIELLQYFTIPSRSFETYDILANAIGIVSGLANYKPISRLTKGYL